MKYLSLQICLLLQGIAVNLYVRGENLTKELCYRGKEKDGEKREERQKESDSEYVKREKGKGREKK